MLSTHGVVFPGLALLATSLMLAGCGRGLAALQVEVDALRSRLEAVEAPVSDGDPASPLSLSLELYRFSSAPESSPEGFLPHFNIPMESEPAFVETVSISQLPGERPGMVLPLHTQWLYDGREGLLSVMGRELASSQLYDSKGWRFVEVRVYSRSLLAGEASLSSPGGPSSSCLPGCLTWDTWQHFSTPSSPHCANLSSRQPSDDSEVAIQIGCLCAIGAGSQSKFNEHQCAARLELTEDEVDLARVELEERLKSGPGSVQP